MRRAVALLFLARMRPKNGMIVWGGEGAKTPTLTPFGGTVRSLAIRTKAQNRRAPRPGSASERRAFGIPHGSAHPRFIGINSDT